MKIKPKQSRKRAPKFIHGIEQDIDKPTGRLPQLNKFHRRRSHG
jgi:hypothetical protein